MASTYSTNLGIELPGTGDQAGVWGNTTNTNLGTLIEQAISGYVTQAVATGTDTTITIPNGATGVARNMYIELTGTGGASTNLIVPANKKLYFIFNNTSSGQVTVKVSGQTGISVPNGKKMILVSNGTDIVTAENYVASLSTDNISYTGTLTGGTGVINIGSGQFYKDAGGFVGIGTATPNARLEVKQVSTITNLSNSYTNSALNIQYTPSVVLAVGTDGTNSLIQAVNSSTNTANSLSIQPFGGNVGIGVTTTPAYKLEVAQSGAGEIAYFRMSNAVALAPALAIEFPSNTPNVATKLQGIRTGSGRDGNIAINADGGNVGIGTASPTFKLQVVGNQRIQKDTAGYEAAMLSFSTLTETGAIYRMGMATGGVFAIGRSDTSTTNLTLDSSGNLGLGVTPSAWGTQPAIQQLGGALWGVNAANYEILQNAFYNGTNYIYRNTNLASRYNQNAGVHSWFTAPSGTAGNAITGANAFVQAMTLDANGNLGVGTSTPTLYGGYKTIALAGGATGGVIDISPSGGISTGGCQLSASVSSTAIDALGPSGGSAAFLAFRTGTSGAVVERGRFSADGTFRVKGAGTAGSTDAVQFSGSAPASAMTLDASGRLLVGTASATASGGLLQIGQVPNSTSSSIGFNNNDNAVISSRYSMVFQNDSDNNIGARDFAWRKGGKGYSDGTSLMTLKAGGNLLVGTTSDAGSRITATDGKTQTYSSSALLNLNETTILVDNTTGGTNGFSRITLGVTNAYADISAIQEGSGLSPTTLAFRVRDGDVNGTMRERFRVNSNGDFGIATTTPTQKLEVVGGIASTGTDAFFAQRALVPSGLDIGAPALSWRFYTTGTTYTTGAMIQGLSAGAWSSTSAPMNMVFYTVPSGSTTLVDRGRFTADGNFLVGTQTNLIASYAFQVGSGRSGGFYSEATGAGDGGFSSVSNSIGYHFYAASTTQSKFYVENDGDVYNRNGTYGTISDQKLKQDIVDAPSQWGDIKSIRFRKYRMKSEVESDANAPYLLGVIAQELEQTSPGLVTETPDFERREVTDADGNVTTENVQIGSIKTVKSSILLMKAAKALQEAMARIESLEAKVAALEAK